MRIKKKNWILTFESTTQAMVADKFGIEQKLPGRLIPIPREISEEIKDKVDEYLFKKDKKAQK